MHRKGAGGSARSSVRADLHTSLEQQRPSCAHDTRTDSRPRWEDTKNFQEPKSGSRFWRWFGQNRAFIETSSLIGFRCLFPATSETNLTQCVSKSCIKETWKKNMNSSHHQWSRFFCLFALKDLNCEQQQRLKKDFLLRDQVQFCSAFVKLRP